MTTDQITEPEEDGEAIQPAEENNEPDIDDAVTITSADIVNEFGAGLAEESEAAAEPQASPEPEPEPEEEPTDPVAEAQAGESQPASASETDETVQDEEELVAERDRPEPARKARLNLDDELPDLLQTTDEEADEDGATPRKQRMRPASNKEIRRVQEAFAACVRCGYFLSDYRMLFGEEHFAEVVGRSRGDWLDLNWSEELRIIVEKSFGVRMDSDLDYYQGCCDMCRRSFVYSAGDDIDATMRVQVRMETPQPHHSGRRRR
ncbi:MAG: hypothetical protein KDE59_12810 [Anaerolineales bacterium]|nr:hypothetical protein [Anaerolineales bacterium]MCB0006029.1 hypothetical protein [Anaerolineales bacterium]